MKADHAPRLPHSIESEQALLGAILHNPDALDRARPHLVATDFFDPVNRQVFEAMCQRHDAGETIDFGLMKAVLGSADLGDGVTVGEYLTRIMRGTTTVASAADYARLIRQAAQMRIVMETSQAAVAAMSVDSVTNPAAYAAHMIETLDAVAIAGLSSGVKRTTLAASASLAMQRVYHLRQTKEEHGVPYGIPSLDRATLGMGAAQFIVIAGRPAMGKTLAALYVAVAAAQRIGPVAFHSCEMNGLELAQRVLASLAYEPHALEEISYRGIAEARSLSDAALARLYHAERRAAAIPIWIEPQPNVTLSQIAARSRQMANKAARSGKKLSAVFVDHIGLIRPSSRYSGNRVQEMTEITTGLKGLAKELDIPVVGLSQLNRDVEKREDKRPQLSDLRESGSIEQDADVVLGIFRESYYLEHKVEKTIEEENRLIQRRNVIEIEILKQRNGPTARIDCFCDVAANVIGELRP